MFSKPKQPSNKENDSAMAQNSTDGSTKITSLEELKLSTEEQMIPPRVKSPPSLLSTDLFVKGNLNTSGDLQIEGSVEGNIRANLLTVGQNALIKGEILAEEVVVNGKISGTVKGKKVHLTSSAKVEGDIVHESIAIESGAHFEGSIEKSEDALAHQVTKRPVVVN